MRDKNKILEEKLILSTEYFNQIHLAYANIVSSGLAFDYVAATTEIVWLHAIPLYF